MDKKLTDNEIIKALECCVSSNGIAACKSGCPFHEKEICLEDGVVIEKYALDLLNRKDAEIEQLRDLVIEGGREQDRLMAEIERLKKGETLSKSGFWNLLCGALVFTKTLEEYNEFRRTIKSEAIKEFA